MTESGGIDRLIVNSPYREPERHWRFDRSLRRFEMAEERRPAGYRIANPKATDPQDPGLFEEFELVNRIRPRVKAWRSQSYPGVSAVTKRLLEHWHDRSTDDRPFFFCQLEAVETLIWLSEAGGADTPGIDVPRDAGPFPRYCAKMATGTGKTVVMAMVIAWQVLNKVARPTDTRFSKNVLVVAPGRTVRERLGVLSLSRDRSTTYYDEFGVVPTGLRNQINEGRVVIRNWQALGWETEALLAKRKGVDKRGAKSDGAWLRYAVGPELARAKNVLVLNDEGHHAWRVPEGMRVGKVSAEEKKAATKWIEALDRIHRARGVLRCYDFSATPFVPSLGTSKTGETLFSWIVSDFGLDDAIEAGLVKTPQVVVSENTDSADDEFEALRPRLYRLYDEEEVKDNLNRRVPETEPLPDLVVNAYRLLGADWLKTAARWKEESEGNPAVRRTPPVMITVANRTETAARIRWAFEKHKVPIPELCDPEGILHIDSGVLKKAEETAEPVSGEAAAVADPEEAKKPARRTQKEVAEDLRLQVNTVGQPGQPGEAIQNVISVGMLTEGWDARTVTHIMGLRAFTSQLLCEQVVGRGLRRTAYDVNPDTGLFDPEYVNVFGVPFTFIPHEKQKAAKPEKPKKDVGPVPERRVEFGMEWPNVIRIEAKIVRRVDLDMDAVDVLSLNAADAVVEAKLAPVVDGVPVLEQIQQADLLAHEAQNRLQRIIFLTVQDLYDAMSKGWTGSPGAFLGQLVHCVEKFLASDKLQIKGDPPAGVSEELWRNIIVGLRMRRIVLHLRSAIRRSMATVLEPVLDPNRPIGATEDMRPWQTVREVEPTKKSHINVAVCDSSWENDAARDLDAHPEVEAWVKNDHLDFELFYIHNGVVKKYRPDFLVRFKNKVTLILEIKGQMTDQVKQKDEALREWVEALNQDGTHGQWTSAICDDPKTLPDLLTTKSTPRA